MKQFWVVGHPIDHSLSPLIHQCFARQFGLTIDYEKRLLEPHAFTSEMRAFFDARIPYSSHVERMGVRRAPLPSYAPTSSAARDCPSRRCGRPSSSRT